MSGVTHNFCTIKFSVDSVLWSGDIFRPQEARLQKIYENHFPGTVSTNVSNFIEINPMVWIFYSGHTHIEFLFPSVPSNLSLSGSSILKTLTPHNIMVTPQHFACISLSHYLSISYL
jgi:hypothetical protein